MSERLPPERSTARCRVVLSTASTCSVTCCSFTAASTAVLSIRNPDGTWSEVSFKSESKLADELRRQMQSVRVVYRPELDARPIHGKQESFDPLRRALQQREAPLAWEQRFGVREWHPIDAADEKAFAEAKQRWLNGEWHSFEYKFDQVDE